MKHADLGLNLGVKRTCKRRFLDAMHAVVPWRDLVALITPVCARGWPTRTPALSG